MIRILAVLAGLLLGATSSLAQPAAQGVDRVVIPVADLDRATAFYTAVLQFTAEATASGRVDMRLGREAIELARRTGHRIPAHSRSNDLWFQHLAIVVSDIDRAYRLVMRAGATPISTAPQLLPAWNPNAGGIRAVYFRDPDGHPLELIQFPPGKSEPRWQDKDRLFLGIDHTAIAARNSDTSIAFYRDRLGLRVAGRSENWGPEQERLSGVEGARVRITTLRAAHGPGIELLDYLAPRTGRPMPADTTPNDLWAEETVLSAAPHLIISDRLRDPDGHFIRLEPAAREASR